MISQMPKPLKVLPYYGQVAYMMDSEVQSFHRWCDKLTDICRKTVFCHISVILDILALCSIHPGIPVHNIVGQKKFWHIVRLDIRLVCFPDDLHKLPDEFQ